ncbi:hypothetical protein OIV83_006348 [Microbotryomycetes sp. JL201]|nr:hypothetical protein OIV83_006348 [Microbotryomycetes sp. JL201]
MTASPSRLPGSFPNGSNSSSQSGSSASPPAPTKSPRRHSREHEPNGLGAGQTRRASGSVQSRRSAVSLGLGVSFAPMNALNAAPSSSRGSNSPSTSHTSGLGSPPRSVSPRSTSPSALSTHSRRSSVGNTSPVSSNASIAALSLQASSTRAASRDPSRRSSLSHLASFLNGIEHHARVRHPGPSGGRGVSRSASRSHSRAGEGRRRPVGAYASEGETDDDSESERGSGSGSRTASRASSSIARSRRSSVSVSNAGDGSPHPVLHELVRENTTGGREGAWEFMDEVDEALLPHTGAEGKIESGHGGPNAWTAAWRSFVSPRLSTLDKSGEEPFLDSAPQSPVPRRTRTIDSNIVEGGFGGVDTVEIFSEGERIGVDVWLEGRGGWVRDCFADAKEGNGPGNGIGGPRELEVERRLGEGTYAIVYLVREVLYDADFAAEDMLSPIDAATAFQFDSPSSLGHRPRMHSWGSDPFTFHPTTYGRHFALKCLCKKDLTPELIEVQRGEAVLHRSLPEHQYIVQLYGAYETDDWLFLVLEYCPGRDLFYWLLESRQGSSEAFDSQANSPASRTRPLSGLSSDEEAQLSRTITASNPAIEMLGDETPPSPSLLASANTSLLSRKRLRLISRMFGQMCQAVQACHDVGISHRDIKPENFIVVENKQNDSEGGSGRITVKITDWGLGTNEDRCEDFDCGSKPYMSYECRNNLAPSYDPRQADVWSLGLVLLNLLYHRNPWADPSLEDPDFSAYVRDQRGFLQDRFDGMPDDVAAYLSENVFCDVLETVDGVPKRRVSAGEFGKWASRLHLMMSDDVLQRQRQIRAEKPISGPFELLSATPRANGGGPLGSSLLSQQFAASTGTTSAAYTKPWSPTMLGDIPRVPSAIDEQDERTFVASSNAPFAFSDDESLPSPTFSPRVSPVKHAPLTGPGEKKHDVMKPPPMLPWNTSDPDPSDQSLPSSATPAAAAEAATPSPILLSAPLSEDAPASPAEPISAVAVNDDSAKEDVSQTDNDNGNDAHPTSDKVDEKEGDDGDQHSQKSKRRKRGARKGKSSRPHHSVERSTSPISLGSPSGLSTVEEGFSKDQLLEDLASASQNLARELSKAPPRSHRGSSGSRPPLSLGSHSTSALRTRDDNHDRKSSAATKQAGGGVFGRFKSLVTEGNPDLEAFKQRAAERNASIGAASAPAKIEGRKRVETPLSSRGSFGASSWGSNWSYEAGDESSRGRVQPGEMSPKHWSSTSNRRERLDKQRRRVESDFSPTSSTRNGTVSTESRGPTPLTSFSSVNSSEVASGTASSSRDWRRSDSPQRPGSRSRQATSESLMAKGPISRPNSGKPKLVDVSVDTADLTAPNSPSSSIATLAPAPPVVRASSKPLSTIKSADSAASADVVARDVQTSSTGVPASVAASGPQKTKLAKMLTSISMFNRNQEKSSAA